MSLLRAQGAAFQYSDATPVLDGLDFVLDAGWTGLVGPNGAGKSTLLRLVTRELQPTSGSVKLEPPEARVVLCPQEVDARTPEVDAFAWSWDGLARRLHGRLRLDPETLDRWDTLSPGERKRWQVGAALASEPDVLLLDEPTNHLDAEALTWLVDALRSFRGLGIVVSHDRALLDALTTRTVRVANGSAVLYTGGYSAARVTWETELQGRLDSRQQAQDHARKTARQLDQARRERESANARRNTRTRMRHRNDSDARGLLAQSAADRAEGILGRRAGIMRRRVEASDVTVEQIEVEKQLGRSVFAQYERCPQPLLAALEAGPIRRGDRVILDAPALTLGREDRIHLLGPNGAGKTTLVAEFLAHLRVPRDRLVVLPQDLAPDEGARAAAALRASAPEERGRILSIVAALGVDPERLLATAQPSPGEARKLLIAEGLGRHVWALVLDEPTNHLDLPSIERLEAALRSYPGALVLVSHDHALAQRCTSVRWRIDDGTVRVE